MIAGLIEIQMLAEMTRLSKDIAEAKQQLNSFASNAQRAADLVRGALGTLGLGLSIGELVAFAKELTNVRIQAESLRTTLDFASGGNTRRELEYLRKTTNDLGLEFQSTATSYAKFQAAARGTAIEGKVARDVFEAMAKASSVMGLSAADTSGVLLALGQMVSKGTVQAEELRGQLGERLPGAFQTAARAMGVTTAELGKLLEQGLVPASDFLPKFAAQINKELGDAAEKATERTEASVNRLTNAWTRAKEVMAEGIPSAAASLGITTTSLAELTAATENARKEGLGFWDQVERGQYALLRLIGPATGTAESVELLSVQLKKAEAEVARLHEGMRTNPGDIALAQYTREAQELVDTLRAAKAAKEQLTAQGTTSQSSQFADASRAIGAIATKGLEDQAAAASKLAAVRNAGLNVNETWLKQINELYALQQRGLISEKDYAEAVKLTTAETYKKTNADKSLIEAGKKLISDAVGRLQVLRQEAALGEKMTDGQKFALDAMEAIRDKRVKLTSAEKMALVVLIEQIDAQERKAKLTKLIEQAEIDAAKHVTKLAEAEATRTEAVRQQLVAEQERLDALQLTAAELRSRETATLRSTAAELEWQAAMEGGNRELEERAQLMRKLADKREAVDAAQAVKEIKEAQVQASKDAAQASADAWKSAAGEISSALTDALMDGGKSGTDYVVSYLRTMLGRAMQAQLMNGILNASGGTGGWFGQLIGATSGGGASGGGNGALNNLSSLGSAYNTISGWMSAGGTAAAGSGLGAVTGPQLYSSMAAYEGIAVSEGAASATAGTAAAGSSAASAIPIIGWIIAAILASKAAYESGNTDKMIEPEANYVTPGGSISLTHYKALTALGMSDKWAQILTGRPLVARLLGHKASVSGYGYGTIEDGDFQQGTLPMQFGKNVLGGGADPFMQDLASRIAGGVSVSAGMFGGGITNGLRVGTMTDRDRENEVASLLGFFGADNKLISGVQTGSGAFGAGGPGQAAAKIKAEDLDKWISDNLPVLIIQGLQQSDLDARFETYFDSVGAAKLTPELAQKMLNTATAVAQLTAAFTPLGGAFTQFEGLSVAAFDQLAKAAGGFDALGQKVGDYYHAFYSESERTKDSWADITRTLKDAGVNTVPATKAEFRALVDSLKQLGTEADQKAFVALMNVAGAFDALTTASDAAAQQVLQERLGLEGQLLQLQGNVTELRRREREQLDATNRPLYDRIAALQDEQRITQQRLGLETQLLQLTGNTAELRRRERAQLDESNRALYDQVKALEDQQQAAERAARNADTWRSMQDSALAGVAQAYQAVEQMVDGERQRLDSEADKAIRDAESKADAGMRELEKKAQEVDRLFGGLLDSLADGIRKLSGELAGDGGRGQALDMLRSGLAALQAGQAVDVDQLRQAAGSVSTLRPDGYASEFAYRRDMATTANLLRDISSATRGQRTTQLTAIAAQQVAIEKARDAQIKAIEAARDQQLHALDQQLLTARQSAGTLVSIDQKVAGVGDAIGQLTAAIAAAQRITTGASTPENTGKWVRSGDTEVWGAAGGATAARPVGAKNDGTLVHGLASTFTLAEGQAWVNSRLAQNDIIGIYSRAKAEGIDSAALDAMMGWAPGTALQGALQNGLAAFADGTGYVPNTGIALVHEGERIIRAQDNETLMEWMGGAGIGADICTRMAEEMRGMRAELEQLRADNNAGHRENHRANSRTAAALENASMGVAPLRTKELA